MKMGGNQSRPPSPLQKVLFLGETGIGKTQTILTMKGIKTRPEKTIVDCDNEIIKHNVSGFQIHDFQGYDHKNKKAFSYLNEYQKAKRSILFVVFINFFEVRSQKYGQETLQKLTQWSVPYSQILIACTKLDQPNKTISYESIVQTTQPFGVKIFQYSAIDQNHVKCFFRILKRMKQRIDCRTPNLIYKTNSEVLKVYVAGAKGTGKTKIINDCFKNSNLMEFKEYTLPDPKYWDKLEVSQQNCYILVYDHQITNDGDSSLIWLREYYDVLKKSKVDSKRIIFLANRYVAEFAWAMKFIHLDYTNSRPIYEFPTQKVSLQKEVEHQFLNFI